MRKLLAAYTPPGIAPAYLNVSQVGEAVEIAVRSPGEPDGACGEAASMSMPIREFLRIVSAAAQELAKP